MFKRKEDEAMPQKNLQKEGGENERNQVIKQWMRDAHELKHLYPDFDINEAIKSEEFYNALAEGKSVFEAYALIINATPKKEKDRQEIFQNAQRARRGTGGSVMNPSKMSREDFKKYIQNIREGL